MSFFNEICNILQGGRPIIGWNIFLVDGKALYIDGVTRIVTVKQDYIAVSVKKQLIEVVGVDLYIKKSSEDSVVIEGEFLKIELPK